MAYTPSFVDYEVVVDARHADRMLAELNRVFSDANMERFLKWRALAVVQRRAFERFRSEGDAASGKWAPLSEATQRFREASGFSPRHPINKRTGELERFITKSEGAIGTQAGESTLRYPGANATGYLAQKVRHAQQGGSNFPARPVLALNEADLELLMWEFAVFLKKEGFDLD